MSLPEPPKLVFKYVKVYYDHGLRACYMCDVEFMLDEDKAEADRFPALTGEPARFLPQSDKQILCPGNTDMMKEQYENPPKPLPASSFDKHFCETCDLTWLGW